MSVNAFFVLLVQLRVSFQNFRRATRAFRMRVFPRAIIWLPRSTLVFSLFCLLRFVITIFQEAIACESFFEFKPLCIEKGDLETGFTESDHVLEGEMRIGAQVSSDFLIGK